jgi:hypothetical protein
MRLRRAATSRRADAPTDEANPHHRRSTYFTGLEGADEPAHAHTRQFRDHFIEFLPETVLVADRLVPQV